MLYISRLWWPNSRRPIQLGKKVRRNTEMNATIYQEMTLFFFYLIYLFIYLFFFLRERER